MHNLAQDLRHGIRMLRSKPGFGVVAVLTLALGIGANTAMFSVVDAVILRPLPYRAPNRLVMVKERVPKAIPEPIPVCAPDVVRFQRENQAFDSMAAFWGGQFDFSAGGEPRRVTGDRVNANLFSVLGTQPALGRAFLPEEDQPGRRVAILSYQFWQRQFGGTSDTVGRSVTLDRQPYTVIGVMPRSFVFPLSGMSQGEAADVFVPMAFTRDELADEGDNFNYSVIGRLKDGVRVERATADLEGIAHRILQTYPAEIRASIDLGAVALPLADQIIGKTRTLLLLLLGAVGFVLLIGCLNIANLLLARATDRQAEIGVRLALGATPLRLLQQFVAESMLLTFTGAALGLMLAFWTRDALEALMPATIPRVNLIGLNLPVLGFTAALALGTGLVFGVVPVLAASRADVQGALKEGGRGGQQGRSRQGMRGVLVMLEVALAMVLLVGAGLLLRSFQHVLETDPGFRPEHVLTASLSLPDSQYKDEAQVQGFYRQLMERLRRVPGVEAAGASTDLPLQAGWNHLFTPEGYRPPPGAKLNLANHSVILGDYLRTLEVPLLHGRYFNDADKKGSTPVLIISEALARKYWPGQDAIGKRLKWGPPQGKDPWRTVVGIVGNVKQGPLDVETTAHTYEPYLQNPGPALNVAIRASGDAQNLASELRATVWSLDPQLAVAQVRTMDQVISESTSPRRFNLFLLGSFALLALLLAAVGIYGVTSYSVLQRAREIGIRVALGAQHGDVLRLVMRQGLRLLAIGVAIGAIGALVLSRLLASFLYGVGPTDPVTFACVGAVLAAIVLLATYIPASRAARVDPVIALRCE